MKTLCRRADIETLAADLGAAEDAISVLESAVDAATVALQSLQSSTDYTPLPEVYTRLQLQALIRLVKVLQYRDPADEPGVAHELHLIQRLLEYHLQHTD